MIIDSDETDNVAFELEAQLKSGAIHRYAVSAAVDMDLAPAESWPFEGIIHSDLASTRIRLKISRGVVCGLWGT